MDILLDLLIPAKRRELQYFNYPDFDVPVEIACEMVETALKSGQGIRSLKRELNKYTLELEFNYEDNKVIDEEEEDLPPIQDEVLDYDIKGLTYE